MRQSELELEVLLPLTPSAQLDDHSTAFNNSNVDIMHSPPDHMDLLADDMSMGLDADDNSNAFNMNLLVPEDCPSLQSAPYSDFTVFGANLTPSSSANCQEANVTQHFLKSPSRAVTDDKELDIGDDLHSPLSGLLEDIAMLDDVRLLDLALDEAVSAGLEQENCLDCDRGQTQPKTHKHSVSGTTGREDQSHSRQQGK